MLIQEETCCENKLVATRVINRGKFWLQKCSMRDFGKGYGIPLEKAMAPHSSTLAWKIPWMEEPSGLQSMGLLKSQTRLSDFTFTFHFHALEKEMATHSSVLAWRIPGTGEPGGLLSMGLHRVGHDWSDLAAARLNLGSEVSSIFILFIKVQSLESHKDSIHICF